MSTYKLEKVKMKEYGLEAPLKPENTDNPTFESFEEYWHFAKHLSEDQREYILTNMPSIEQQRLRKSFDRGGWLDLLMRDLLDKLVDRIAQRYGSNILELRARAISGKSVYVSRQFWEYVESELCGIDPKHKQYILGGIKGVPCKSNNDVILLVRLDNVSEEEM